MVTAVSGSLLSALIPGSPAAKKLAQQNAVLPNPLQTSEDQAKQRQSALLKFDRPQVAQSTLSNLQDSALRNYAVPERSGDDAALNGDTTADAAGRATQAYQSVLQSLQPLQALSTPPRPVPNPAALAPGAAEDKDKQDAKRVSERDKERGTERNGRGDATRETQNERGLGLGRDLGRGPETTIGAGSAARTTDSNAGIASSSGLGSSSGIGLGAQVDLGA